MERKSRVIKIVLIQVFVSRANLFRRAPFYGDRFQ